MLGVSYLGVNRVVLIQVFGILKHWYSHLLIVINFSEVSKECFIS